MKKVLMYFLFFIILILVTGCEVDDEVKDELFKSLQKQEIIEEDLDFITSFTSKNIGLFISSETYYLYEDDDDDIIAIRYLSCTGDSSCDYRIFVYDVELTDEELLAIDEDDIGGYENYYILDDEYFENINYELTLSEEYFATEHKRFLFFKYYKFDLVE